MAPVFLSKAKLSAAIAAGETCRAIARRTGYSTQSIAARAKLWGLPVKLGRPCLIDRSEVLRRRAAGATFQVIADALGVSAPAVWKIVRAEQAK